MKCSLYRVPVNIRIYRNDEFKPRFDIVRYVEVIDLSVSFACMRARQFVFNKYVSRVGKNEYMRVDTLFVKELFSEIRCVD